MELISLCFINMCYCKSHCLHAVILSARACLHVRLFAAKKNENNKM
jgi:hypothetical protein